MELMSRHRKVRTPGWWIPFVTLGSLLVMGIVAVVTIASGGAHTGSEAPAIPSVVQITVSPPAKPLPHPSPAQTTYQVQRGDSWWTIAARFCHNGASMAQLASRNHYPLYGALPLGKTITIICR